MAVSLMPASADAATTHEGTAYRVDNGAAAYRESHMTFQSGGRPARLVLYRCMDGSTFARKIVLERSDAATPDFDFMDGRTGFREGVRSSTRGREVFWQKSATAVEQTKTLAIPANGVIDAGFDAMVRKELAINFDDEGKEYVTDADGNRIKDPSKANAFLSYDQAVLAIAEREKLSEPEPAPQPVRRTVSTLSPNEPKPATNQEPVRQVRKLAAR